MTQVHRRLRAGRGGQSCFRSASSRLPAARSPDSTRSSPAAPRRKSSRAKATRGPIGYGAMCLESLVAIMAMIAACTLDPGRLSQHERQRRRRDAAAIAADTVQGQGYGFRRHASSTWTELARRACRKRRLFGRTGGAATLAVGMAQIFSKARQRTLARSLVSLRDHVRGAVHSDDARCRHARRALSVAGCAGHVWKPLGDTQSISSELLASVLIVAGWGYFLIQGVRDPARRHQLALAALRHRQPTARRIALCLATTIILKMQLARRAPRIRIAGRASLYIRDARSLDLAAFCDHDRGSAEDFSFRSAHWIPCPSESARREISGFGTGTDRGPIWRRNRGGLDSRKGGAKQSHPAFQQSPRCRRCRCFSGAGRDGRSTLRDRVDIAPGAETPG